MKGMVQCVAVRLAVAVALTVSATAYAQDNRVAKSNDPETQTAVADYNAGNLAAALTEFRKAAEHGSRLAEFNYAMMLMRDGAFAAHQHHCVVELCEAVAALRSLGKFVEGVAEVVLLVVRDGDLGEGGGIAVCIRWCGNGQRRQHRGARRQGNDCSQHASCDWYAHRALLTGR